QTKYGDSYNCVDFYEQPAFDHPLLKDHKYEFQVDGLMTIEKDTYYGGGMASSIYHHAVQSSQYSSSRVKYQNGPDSIAVGWTVNPSLYPDNQTHMFIYTTTKDSHCYNTFCPGFIILRSDIPPDVLLGPYYSVRGGNLYENIVFVYKKDAANGNWFLEIGNEKLIIGTWPQKIFTSLADSANYIEWGGEVYGPSVDVLPPMGTGYIPDSGDFEQDCYARKISVINKDHIVTQPPASCILYQTSARYGLVDGGIQGDSGRVIFYGGPASAPMAFQINNK
ncbi:hypothetical protein LINPERPRIM_LOCUS23983, partial [Linum perenne]